MVDQLISGFQNNILDYLISCEYSFQNLTALKKCKKQESSPVITSQFLLAANKK